jgi:hypothetical protein
MSFISGRERFWIAGARKCFAEDNSLAMTYSSLESISASVGLCFDLRRSARGLSSMTRSALGWPTRARAFALTALTAENFFAFFFVMLAFLTISCLSISMKYFRRQ